MTTFLASRQDYERVRQLHDLMNDSLRDENIMDVNHPMIVVLSDMAYWLDSYRRQNATYIEYVHMMSRAIEALESDGGWIDTHNIWDGVYGR